MRTARADEMPELSDAAGVIHCTLWRTLTTSRCEEEINMSFGEAINSSHLHKFRKEAVRTNAKVVLTNQINVRCVDCKECTFGVFEHKEC